MDIYITLHLLWVCYQAFYMIQVPMQRIMTIFLCSNMTDYFSLLIKPYISIYVMSHQYKTQIKNVHWNWSQFCPKQVGDIFNFKFWYSFDNFNILGASLNTINIYIF